MSTFPLGVSSWYISFKGEESVKWRKVTAGPGECRWCKKMYENEKGEKD